MKNIYIMVILLTISAVSFAQETEKTYSREADGRLLLKTNATTEIQEFTKEDPIIWYTPLNISQNENEDSRDFGIAMGPDSTLHMVYCDDRPLPGAYSQRIVHRSKGFYEEEWSEDVIIDEFSGLAPRNNHKASINVSNNGNIHVVYHYWAYDGTGRDQVGYTKYTKDTDTWSSEVISGDAGTIASVYSDYPKLTTTTNNITVVVWGTDNRNGNDEAYLAYDNGGWQEPILISSPEMNKAQWPVVVAAEDEQVLVLFREYTDTHDSLSVYYRVFDASTGDLGPIHKIQRSQRLSTSNFDYYDQFTACYANNNKVFIADNARDTIHSYYFDMNTEILSKNHEVHISNYTGNPNYNLMSVCADDDDIIHFCNTIWNVSSNAVRYISYEEGVGFGEDEIVSHEDAIDAPRIIWGVDKELHIAFCDDSEDTNDDGYVDREVYYTTEDNTLGWSENSANHTTFNVYPNPSSTGVFTTDLKENYTIAVYRISGELIYSSENASEIDLSSYANGVYIMKARNAKYNLMIKLIKK
ncbi:MAG: hypothetical protein B7C24_01870 [Bacteroidetes bacterium 4572_77]|nr:MAG: hypothetical protein B7C24_01870 [Bacteroidetes bacterium 4572_77]